MKSIVSRLVDIAREREVVNSSEIGPPAYELAKTRLANYLVEIEPELRQRIADEQEAARELNIDPPEPGTSLARAFAANASLRRERDAAYQKGRDAARKEILAEIERLRYALRSEPCDCPRMSGLAGPHQRGDVGCRYEAQS